MNSNIHVTIAIAFFGFFITSGKWRELMALGGYDCTLKYDLIVAQAITFTAISLN